MQRRAMIILLGAISVGVPAHAAAKPLKITVYGCGRVGSRIVSEALDRGHIVTVVVRKPEDVTLKNARLTVVEGDLLDAAGVTKQIAGQDVVVGAINSPVPQVMIDGNHAMIAALRAAVPKPTHYIYIGGASSLLTDSGKMLFESNPIPNASTNAPGHIATLEYFRTVTDVPWTFFSPAVSTTPGTRTGKFRLGGDHPIYDAKGVSFISMEDIAVVVIDEAENPKHIRQRFTAGY